MALRGGKFEKIVIIILLIGLTVFLMPEIAWVVAQQQEGERLLEEGKKAMEQGKYEEAVEKLNLAMKVLEDKDKFLDATINLAFSYFALGESNQAKDILEYLLIIQPGYKFDPEYYPPDFIDLVEEAKKGFLAKLTVETTPPAAQLYVDEKLIGVTPTELTVIPDLSEDEDRWDFPVTFLHEPPPEEKKAGLYVKGAQKVKITKQGYNAIETEIPSLGKGESKTLIYALEKAKGPDVATTPSEEKPEAKKKSNTLLWLLIGGGAAAAVLLLASGGGGDETPAPTPSPTPQQPTLTVHIKTTHTMANMRAYWKILVDGDIVKESWLEVPTHGGANAEFGSRIMNVRVPLKPGAHTVGVWGYDMRKIYQNETAWVKSTRFEISIVGPPSQMNRYVVDPSSFLLNVATWAGGDWPQQDEQRINIRATTVSVKRVLPGLTLPQEIEYKNPN